MSVRVCRQCGAPLEHTEQKPLVCHFCKTEQAEDGLAPKPPVARSSARLLVGAALVLVVVGGVVFVATRGEDAAPASLSVTVPSANPAPLPSAVGSVGSVSPIANSDAGFEDVTLTLSAVGEGEGAFAEARRVAVDSKGAVFVADKTGRVQKFDANGAFISMFRAETSNKPHGAKSTDIAFIQGLAVDRKDRAWVSIGYDLVVYDASSGAKVQKISHQYPTTCFRDLTFDQTGALFARTACTDSDHYGIVKFDSGGRVLASWSESPAWQTDSTDKLAIDATGNIFAPHQYENRVVVLDAQGKETNHFGGRGKTLGFFDVSGPTSLAADAKGRLYAVNEDFIDVYDREGHAQRRISSRWNGRARDIAIGPDGQLWVLTNNGVTRIRPRE